MIQSQNISVMFICKPRYKCGVVASENAPAHAESISVAVSTDTISNAKYASFLIASDLCLTGRWIPNEGTKSLPVQGT